MLSREEIEAVEDGIRKEETPRSTCIAAMNFIQKQRGYVSDEALADLAPMLGMSVSGLESVATFYSLIFRKPVGKHVILLCDSVSCWILGKERVLDHLRQTARDRPRTDHRRQPIHPVDDPLPRSV